MRKFCHTIRLKYLNYLWRRWQKRYGTVKVNITDADGEEHTEYMKYDKKKWAEWRWINARIVDRGDK